MVVAAMLALFDIILCEFVVVSHSLLFYCFWFAIRSPLQFIICIFGMTMTQYDQSIGVSPIDELTAELANQTAEPVHDLMKATATKVTRSMAKATKQATIGLL